MLTTDLLGQVIQVPTPTKSEPDSFAYGRVRVVYVSRKSRCRLVVLLTTGYLVDLPADSAKVSLDDK